MADKTQFRTIETDEEELNTKIRKHRLKIMKIILLVLALIAVVAVGIFFFQKLRKYQFIPMPMMSCTGTRPMR